MKFLLHLSCIFPACLAKCVDFLASQYINDDYCDCSDGTDETLTNACNNGYFTCSNIGHKSISISSFKLNDDFCDCCDGSDEAKGKCPYICDQLAFADSLKAKEAEIKKSNGINRFAELLQTGQQTMNRASKVISDLSDSLKMLDRMLMEEFKCFPRSIKPLKSWNFDFLKRTRLRLLQSIKKLQSVIEMQWPQFIPLLNKCFSFSQDSDMLVDFNFSHSYTVCLFDTISQERRGERFKTTIGRWDRNFTALHELSFSSGDSCEGGKRRQALVTFECGDVEKVKSVIESSLCHYSIVFETSAVCNPNLL